jgi:hypothetical protein
MTHFVEGEDKADNISVGLNAPDGLLNRRKVRNSDLVTGNVALLGNLSIWSKYD